MLKVGEGRDFSKFANCKNQKIIISFLILFTFFLFLENKLLFSRMKIWLLPEWSWLNFSRNFFTFEKSILPLERQSWSLGQADHRLKCLLTRNRRPFSLSHPPSSPNRISASRPPDYNEKTCPRLVKTSGRHQS